MPYNVSQTALADRAELASRARVIRVAAAAALATLATFAAFASAGAQRRHRASAEPQELHGSKESVEKMYSFAQSHGLTFYLTPTNVSDAIASGRLVALTGDSTYELTRGVGFSYATREARAFVLAFAPQYLAACGTPLTVTSAARPVTRQPHNANPHSVHPTGIAVDLRRPSAGPCLTWVRGALAQLEDAGVIEATEEHHPVHLHIAVLVAPGGRVTLPDLVKGQAVARVAPTPVVTAVSQGDVAVAKNAHTYVVRQGDTLWEIANRTGVSVKALLAANKLASRKALKPGLTLTLPTAPSGAQAER